MINIWIDTKISRLVGYMSRDGWLYPNPLWLVMNPINIPWISHYITTILLLVIYTIKYPSIDIPDSFIHTNDIPLVGSPSHRNPGGVSRPLRCQDSAVRPESRLCPHCCASETTAERLGKKGDRTRKNGELPREKWQKMLISAAKNADRTALNQLK